MYGLKRLNHFAALFTAAAPYQERLLRFVPPSQSSRSSHAAAAGLGRKRREWMPQELSGAVVKLKCKSSADGGICNVYLVGSNHSCGVSRQIVQNVVQFLKPEVVFLELCSDREFIINGQNKKVPTIREIVDMWKNNQKPSWIIFNWYLANTYQCYTSYAGEFYAGEFYAANAEAMKYGGKVILGDRPNGITMQRYLAKKSLLDLLVDMYGPSKLPEDIRKKLKGKIHANAVDRLNQATAKNKPVWAETFIHERDLYMSAKLLEVAREHKSVVAVVGKGHIPGIKKHWKQPVDVEQLLSIPIEEKPITIESVLGFIFGVVFIIMKLIRRHQNIKRCRQM